jgi:hypothetical protein
MHACVCVCVCIVRRQLTFLCVFVHVVRVYATYRESCVRFTPPLHSMQCTALEMQPATNVCAAPAVPISTEVWGQREREKGEERGRGVQVLV